MSTWTVSTRSPGRLRSFDPLRVGDLEYRMWVSYYRRQWVRVLLGAFRLAWLGFGADWLLILQSAALLLRAVILWAPFPDNDADGARACMSEIYGLVRHRFGEPVDPAQAAKLEVNWWTVHRERQYAPESAELFHKLVEAVTHLYCCLFSELEAAVRPAAVFRVQAMDLSDQWVREGCQPDSPLLPLERATLVRAYAALLAAVHHE